MFRLISIILIIAGLGALSLGLLAMVSPAPPAPPTPGEARESAPQTPPSSTVPAPDVPGLETPNFTPQTAGGQQADPVRALRSVPIAHETPSAARFGQPFDVTVAIDATGNESASDALPGSGNIVEGIAQVGMDVRVSLVGSAFEVEGLSPPDQTVSTLTANTWRWKVTPLASGQHDLMIEVFALDGPRALPVRTFRDTVTVEVSTLRQAIDFAQAANPLFMVLGGIGSVLGGAFTALRFFSKASGRG